MHAAAPLGCRLAGTMHAPPLPTARPVPCGAHVAHTGFTAVDSPLLDNCPGYRLMKFHDLYNAPGALDLT